MSQLAILTAVPQYLIDILTPWDTDNCKAMPNGRPEPMMGKTFASVHMTGIQSQKTDGDIHEEVYGFAVTVSKRIEAVPYGRITSSVYLLQLGGLAPLMEQVKYAIHNRWTVTNAINAAIPVYDVGDELEFGIDQFVTSQEFTSVPVVLNQTPKITFQDEDWFHGSHGTPTRDQNDGHVGISMTHTFGQLIKFTKLVVEDCS